ncbi:MAG: GNAT family N-acetyltransferase [Candidatus Gracilibacteria bacterium]|jgi:predicted GNAT family acetyltransferase
MEKSFLKLIDGSFSRTVLPSLITIEIVKNKIQLKHYCLLKAKFLFEEGGSKVNENKLYSGLQSSYSSVIPAIMYFENIPIGIVNSNFNSEKSAMINMLFIDNTFRSNGYGKLLLAWYIAELQKISVDIYLFFSPSNIPAQRLYSRLGFKKIEEWKMVV